MNQSSTVVEAMPESDRMQFVWQYTLNGGIWAYVAAIYAATNGNRMLTHKIYILLGFKYS